MEVYANTFFLTFRNFTTPSEVLEHFRENFLSVLPDNPTAEDIEYFKQRKMLHFYLSSRSKNVDFYHGKLIDGKIFPKGAIYTSIRKGIGEIALQPEDRGKTFHVIARVPTKYKNALILQGSYTFR